ncbi:PLP-dependent transferase [Dichomitus squalens]|uniref:PLP-dependent transferase n=1 Tax=Dichomitus squalens (strain LYAD-421) TaxID=732165 RepID=UPI0004411B61|nr:PLP-dependent transferase [Dichomitus squalens LYAD-421 SS1]EJF65434.1 PLP-dependent transferase [Dichomitus squalens LYAD-421 SS1]TBU45803.1 PLP-dependent transferase [Dichomitus squalens]
MSNSNALSLVAAAKSAVAVLWPAGHTPWQNLTNAIVVYYVVSRTLKAHRHLRARGIVQTAHDFYQWVLQETILLALRLPSARKKVETELGKTRLDIEKRMVPQGPGVTRHLSLPAQGHDQNWILEEMAKMDEESGNHVNWRDGKVSGAIYHGGEDMQRVIVAAFERYCVSNPLHPDVFPAVRKMEAEIVAMCLKMYNNPTGAGVTTSGGTESIIMAVKTYRDWARATKGITDPEIVIPISAHAAFDKGAAYLGVKVHTIPVHPETRQVDIRGVRRAINPNTILLVGSAINFPDGNQDDIVALGKLASKHKIGLHVDCCLGSFIMPFLEEAGFPVQPFDFRVQGVTSISCDTHKYGFAPKGNSVVMYKDAQLRRFQYYINPHWVGGVYASPSIAGSRPGALIAGTWAAMQYMGHNGYLESCKSIVTAAKTIAHRIRTEIPELRVLGNPPASVVAFAAAHKEPGLNVLEVGDKMSKRGWHLNGISNPAAVHIAVTRLTVPVVDQLIADLKDAVGEAKLSPSGQGTMVMLYGLGKSSPVGSALVGRVAEAFLDTLYKA